MSMLPDEVKQEVKKKFDKELKNPVKLIYFTEKLECQFCKETHQLLDEIGTLSDKISLDVFNFAIDKEEVDKYKIDKIPAIVIMNEKDYGIRLFGLPAGYEFSSLIEGTTIVPTGKTGLNEKSIEKIATLTNPVHGQIFVTNTCPYCPTAMQFAHKLAFLSDKINADAISASEFVPLAQKYNVYGVPKVVINEKITFEGSLPEESFVEQVISADKL